MDLQEVARRVLLGHWVLILACILVSAGGVVVYHLFDTPTYSASTRVVLDAPAPTSGTEATAVADSAKAIVTSPTHIIAALNAAGVNGRDPVKEAPNITLAPLGTSGVLLLTVKDTNPETAVAIANALANDLIQTRLAVSPAAQKAAIDAQIKTVTDRISTLNVEIAALKKELDALKVDPANPQAASVQAQILSDRITADDNDVATLTQELIHLDSERAGLGSAADTIPSVIDAAQVALKDPSRLPIDLALALIIGAVAGVAIAGARETFRPTLASGESVAKALSVPVLGWLPDISGTLAIRLKMVASASDVRALELIGVGAGPDLSALARSLRGPLSQGQGEGKGVSIFSIEDAPPRFRTGQAPPSGFILVTPERINKSALEPVQELITISGRPLLGVIAHKPTRSTKTSIPFAKPSPHLAVVLDGDKDPAKGMSKEMQSDLWGAQ